MFNNFFKLLKTEVKWFIFYESTTSIQKTFLGNYDENLVKNILKYFAMYAPIYEFDENIKNQKIKKS